MRRADGGEGSSEKEVEKELIGLDWEGGWAEE